MLAAGGTGTIRATETAELHERLQNLQDSVSGTEQRSVTVPPGIPSIPESRQTPVEPTQCSKLRRSHDRFEHS